MAERSIHADLRTALLNNDPFNYAHLIKFERPILRDGDEKESGLPHEYTYLTDAAYNIAFDDGVYTAAGDAAGTQTYIANKVLKVGDVKEDIRAKIGGMSLTLDSSTLSTSVAVTATVVASAKTFVSNIDLSEYYQEGDKVFLVDNSNGGNEGKSFIIERFAASNTVHYTPISTDALVNASSVSYTTEIQSEELTALVRGRGTVYNGYLNRRVSIWKAHINPETGVIVGAPYLLFKGLISKGDIKENVSKDSKIIWSLTSHWGDFQRVSGRFTSDDAHRALDPRGAPDPASAGRPEYVYDKGFAHAETAVNVTSTYTTYETRSYYREDQSFFGMGTGANIEYQEPVQRQVDLAFNLSAKYLPVIYGVQKTKSIPIFADTHRDSSALVYTANAICEGPIGGILDLHIDDTPLICTDEQDQNRREPQGFTVPEGVDAICYGRADQGDCLQGFKPAAAANSVSLWDWSSQLSGTEAGEELFSSTNIINTETEPADDDMLDYLFTSVQSSVGWTDNETFTLDLPIKARFKLHTGTKNQSADPMLYGVANQGLFHLQQYYPTPDDYWTAEHKLLDTAYTTAMYTISEGETTIPDVTYIVQGRSVECHHYDDLFKTAKNNTLTLFSAFNAGDEVAVKSLGTNYSQTVTISDKFSTGIKVSNFQEAAVFTFDETLTLVDSGTPVGGDIYMERTIAIATDAAATAGSNNKTIPLAKTSGLLVGMVVTSATDASNITSNSKIASIVDGVSIVLDKNIAEDIGSGDTINFTATWNLINHNAPGTLTGTVGGPLYAQIDHSDSVTNAAGTAYGKKLKLTGIQTGFNKITTTARLAFFIGNPGDWRNYYASHIEGIRLNDTVIDNVASNRPIYSIYSHVYMTDGLYMGASFSGTPVAGDVVSVTAAHTRYGYSSFSTQDRVVKAYDSTNKVITVDAPWDINKALPGTPNITWTYKIVPAAADNTISDTRQTLNPAMHMLDYLTNTRYGAGLDKDTEIDLDSFKASALKCDERSTIKVAAIGVGGTTKPTVGHIYTYPDTNATGYVSGDLLFRGKVKSVADATVTVAGQALWETEFEDVYGSIVKRVNNFTSIAKNQLIYSNGEFDIPAGTVYTAGGTTGLEGEGRAFIRSGASFHTGPGNTVSEGLEVTIVTSGVTDLTCMGAANNNVGTVFNYENNYLGEKTAFWREPAGIDTAPITTIKPSTSYTILHVYDPNYGGFDFRTLGASALERGVVFTTSSSTTSFAGLGVLTPTSAIRGAGDTLIAGKAYYVITNGADADATAVIQSGSKTTGREFIAKAGAIPGGSAFKVVSLGTSGDPHLHRRFRQADDSFEVIPVERVDDTCFVSSGEITNVNNITLYRDVAGQDTLSLNAGKVSGTITAALLGDKGNPVVKAYRSDGTWNDSGYSLYEASDVRYWKYVGWPTDVQRNVTRHQMNQRIDTANPVFDNVNKMLSQFNGILRYGNGKYSLDIKSKHGTATAAEKITEDDIIGAIALKDGGQKGIFNSISANIVDPQLQFEARQINFMNSDYLKQDRSVPKKGNYSAPGITNYYNARFNIKQILDESRSSLSISFEMGPKGLLLTAGSTIEITYPRFGFVSKLFRISSLTFKENSLVGVVAQEHDDDAYVVSPTKATAFSEKGPSKVNVLTTPDPVTSVTQTAVMGGTKLSWALPSTWDPITQKVEIHRGSSNSLYASTTKLIAEVSGNEYTDTQGVSANTTNYYWATAKTMQASVNTKSGKSALKTVHSLPAPYNVDGEGLAAVSKSARTPGNFVFGVSALTDADSSAEIEALFNGSNAPLPLGAIEGDVVSFYTGTQASPTGAAAYERGSSASAWAALTTVTAAAGVFGTLAADNFAANTITVGKLSGDVNEEYTLDIDLLNKSITGTQQATTILHEFSLPAPTGGVAKKSKVDIAVRFKVTTTNVAQNVFTNFTLERKSKGAVDASTGVITLGSAAANGTVEATLVERIKIAGNVLAKVQAGSISDTVNGSSWQGSIRGAWYDLGDNQTYILFTQPANTSGNLVASGEAIYFSPDSFASTGTFIAASSVFDGGLQAYVQTTVQPTKLASYNVKATLGSTTSATEFRLKAFNGATHSTGVTAVAQRISGTMEHIV